MDVCAIECLIQGQGYQKYAVKRAKIKIIHWVHY